MARDKREKARAMLAEGKDPAAQKKLAIINAHIAHRATFKLLGEGFQEQAKDLGLAETTLRKKRWFLPDLAAPLQKHEFAGTLACLASEP